MGTWLIGLIGLFFSIIATAGGGESGIPVLCVSCVVWVIVIGLEGTANQRHKAKAASNMAPWQECMAVWKRLFYCPRCNHVYDPVSQDSAPPERTMDLMVRAAICPPPD